ncbi:MAG TPA: amidohydrolase family protein [Thermoanaerobaculia bacterium]|jgi:imidazolonepropionase-like amidohydrolase
MRIFRIAVLTLLAAACAHQQNQRDAPQTPAAPGEQTLRYAVLMSTNKAGSQVVTRRGDEITVDYEYNDRGRGPKTHTVMRLDARGVPVSLALTGNDYFKTPVEERFAVANGRATWKNTAETGEAASNGFYASMYGPPEELAVLARALLRNGGRMSALPGGELAIRKVGETSIRGTHATAYELTGLGFTPFELWLDDELNLFGAVSAWQTTIREGFEADAKALLDAQDARAAERIGTMAAKHMRKPTGGRVTLMNARIFDPRNGTLSAPTTINIEGNRIQSIGVPQERNAADIIDVAGKVVLPGLWDMHTHVGDVDALLNIAAGITSIRDLGNDSDTLLALKERIETGRAIGPRIALAGLVDGPGPFQGPTNILAGNEEEARKAVDFFADRKYEGLKIYSSIKPELVPVLTNYAHRRGLRVSGHIPAGMRASDAVDAGYDEIQHANMLFLNFMPDVTDTRTPARFTEVAKRAADLDLDSAEVRAFIEKLRARNVAVDPTVAIFEEMFTARAGTISPGYAMVAERFPPQVKRGFLTGGLPVPEGMDERYRASFAKMLELVAALHRAGVTIVAGTDALAGFALHRELELYARAGIPNAEVLRIATLVPAQLLKRERDLGTIEPGKLADLIIVDGNPLETISDIRRVVTVVKDGVVFDPKALYAELGVR